MSKPKLQRLWLAAALCLLVLPGTLASQIGPGEALRRIRGIQARHTERLMSKAGVVGVAAGTHERGGSAVLVLLERSGVRGIPKELDGVPVQTVVTGKIYALGSTPALAQLRWPWWFWRDRTAPAAPTGLTADPDGGSQIDLDWADNSESDIDYYNVYRSTTAGGSYSRIASVNERTSRYTDSGLAPSTTYYYVVAGVDTSSNRSRYSNEAQAATDAETTETTPFDRPAPIGASTGHFNVTAGTIGCRVTKDGQVYALSNNHVYADENRASIGDNVLQPGPYDGGQNPRDAIGTLAEYESISFSRWTRNRIDAAIAVCSEQTLDNKTPGNDSYGIPSSTTVDAVLGLKVRKHGRSSGLTTGEIYALNATVNVTYDRGTARFVDQIVITPGTFIAAGDSGALVVTGDDNNPVGLIFAGSSSFAIANPIDAVLGHFGVAIDDRPPED